MGFLDDFYQIYKNEILLTLQKLYKKTEERGTCLIITFELYFLMENVGDSFYIHSDSYFEGILGFFGSGHSDRHVSHKAQAATLHALKYRKIFFGPPLSSACSPWGSDNPFLYKVTKAVKPSFSTLA